MALVCEKKTTKTVGLFNYVKSSNVHAHAKNLERKSDFVLPTENKKYVTQLSVEQCT